MSRPLKDSEIDALEALIDACGLARVVDGIAEVCDLKAMHIREAWQDEALAREWNKAGVQLDKVSSKLEAL